MYRVSVRLIVDPDIFPCLNVVCGTVACFAYLRELELPPFPLPLPYVLYIGIRNTTVNNKLSNEVAGAGLWWWLVGKNQ